MSTLVTPSAPSAPFYIGKGLSGGSGSLTIFGYDLPNYLSSIINSTLGSTPWSIVNATTDFDVSTLTENHEVPVVLYVCPYSLSMGITVTFNWIRQHDGVTVFYYTSSLSNPPEGQEWSPGATFTAWIGWLSESVFEQLGGYYEEIMENGYYYCNISVTGGTTQSANIDFVVRGMPAFTRLSNPTPNGFDWKVGLTNTFDNASYIRVGVCTQSFTNGQSSAPSGILQSVSAPSAPEDSCVAEGLVTSLYPATTYTIYGFAQASNGYYYTCGSYTITTTGAKLTTPTLAFTSSTKTSITLSIGTVTGGYYYDVNVFDSSYNYLGTSTSTTSSITLEQSTISGIVADSDYYFKVSARPSNYSYYNDSNQSGYYGAWSTQSNRPSQFTWDTSKVSGQSFNIAATEWNRLIQSIKDIYNYKEIPSYTPTMYDVTAGSNFEAVNDFNKIKNAIGYFYNNTDPASGVGISDKSLGDTVYASYFDGDYSIVKKLNDIT